MGTKCAHTNLDKTHIYATILSIMIIQNIKQANKLNILYDLSVDNDRNGIECRVYIGDKKQIPTHLRKLFIEAIKKKMLRWVVSFIANYIFFSKDPEFRSYTCTIPVKKIDEKEFLLSWKIEDIFLLLKECGFCLYAQENDGAFWTPHGIFQELVKLNRIQQSMPVFFRNRAGNQFVLTDTSETAVSSYSNVSVYSNNPDSPQEMGSN